MNNKLEFLDHDFEAGRLYLLSTAIEPDQNSIGLFNLDDPYYGSGGFYWFNNEDDMKLALLNGWYAVDTEERDEEYYAGVPILKKFLESPIEADDIYKEIPEELNSFQEIIWSGHILNLLTDKGEFPTKFREHFKDYLNGIGLDSLGITDHENLYMNICSKSEIIELLVEYVKEYFWE